MDTVSYASRSTPTFMKKTHTLWIAVLTCTAMVMGALLLKPTTAQAAMVNAQPNYILLTTGNPAGEEFLVIIDRQSERIAIYHQNGDQMALVAHGPIAAIK